jgi:hypothetical protein
LTGPAPSPLERFRNWVGASFYRRVGITLGGTALVIALLVDTASYVSARSQIHASVERLLEAESTHEYTLWARI